MLIVHLFLHASISIIDLFSFFMIKFIFFVLMIKFIFFVLMTCNKQNSCDEPLCRNEQESKGLINYINYTVMVGFIYFKFIKAHFLHVN